MDRPAHTRLLVRGLISHTNRADGADGAEGADRQLPITKIKASSQHQSRILGAAACFKTPMCGPPKKRVLQHAVARRGCKCLHKAAGVHCPRKHLVNWNTVSQTGHQDGHE